MGIKCNPASNTHFLLIDNLNFSPYPALPAQAIDPTAAAAAALG